LIGEGVPGMATRIARAAAVLNENGSWSSLKKPYWQPYWWRLLFRADGEPGWDVLGPKPFSPVPSDALKKTSLDV
jgi:hypothetical protein